MFFFAYGSSMNLSQMRRVCGWNCRLLGPTKLLDYEFGMDMRGYNNVRPKAGEFVWGVLFEINEAALTAMDEFEGYPDVFNRAQVKVTDPSGQSVTAWIYLEPADQFGNRHGKPDHVRGIVAGSRENGLPEEWVRKLETFLS